MCALPEAWAPCIARASACVCPADDRECIDSTWNAAMSRKPLESCAGLALEQPVRHKIYIQDPSKANAEPPKASFNGKEVRTLIADFTGCPVFSAGEYAA